MAKSIGEKYQEIKTQNTVTQSYWRNLISISQQVLQAYERVNFNSKHSLLLKIGVRFWLYINIKYNLKIIKSYKGFIDCVE
jgi:hypothetical protein